MPKINRIRIINFSYNGDKRLILDELFNFHQGEDALISLKNGGGKSVLVQAMMQPILPNVRLQNRKMSDFFVRKKQPAYILIEWKLDDNGGNLLTGIAMMSKESGFQEQEDGTNAVKYFTFTSHYKLTDSMDIKHIALTTKEKNRIVVKNYGEAQKYIQEARKSHGASVAYYSENDKRTYQKDLESFNIHPDEWKTVLLPVNSEEGGLIKIFEKCRTPRMLLRDWILNTVNKVIFDDQNEAQSLTEMMGNLAQSMIDNESFILERDLLKGFSDRLKILSKDVYNAASTHSEMIEKEQELRALEQFLNTELERLEKEKADAEENLEEKKKELTRIEQEKLSEDYHKAEEDLEKHRIVAEDKRKEFDLVAEQLDKVSHDIDVMEARLTYEEIMVLLERKAEIETELQRLREPSEDQEMIDRLAYSLKVAYEDKYREVALRLLTLRDQLQQLKVRREVNTKEETEIREAEKSAIKEKEKCSIAVSAYEIEERELLEAFNISIQRNLMKGLDEKAIGILTATLENNLISLQKSLVKLEENKEKAQKEEEAVLDEIPKAEIEKSQKEVLLKKLQDEIREFEVLEGKLLEVLHRYDISPSKRFQKEYLLSEFKELIETGQEKLDGAKEEIQSIEKRMSAMESGILHVSEDFYDHLIDSGLEFDTGEHYLQNHSIEIRNKLLKENPLLPYAFLMTEEELEKLKELKVEHPLLQPVPVLTYGSLEGGGKEEGRFLAIGKGRKIIVEPDLKLFESDGMESYRRELGRLLEEEKKSRKHYEDFLKELRINEKLIEDFGYSESFYKEAKAEEEQLQRIITVLKERGEALKRKRTELRNLFASLEKQREDQKKKLEEGENKLRKLEAHLLKNKDYESDLKRKHELEKELERFAKSLLELSIEMGKLGHEESKAVKDIWTLEGEERNVLEAQKEFQSASEKPLEEGSIEELLVRYLKYQEDLNGNIKSLERELTSKSSELKNKERSLERKGISKEEYLNVRYLESEGDRLLALKKSFAKEKETKASSSKEADMKVANLSGKFEARREDMKSKGIQVLPFEEINGNYSERKDQCKLSMRTLEDRRKTLEITSRTYGDIRDKIDEKLRESKIKAIIIIWDKDREVETGFREVSGKLNDLKDKLKNEKIEIQQNFRNLKDDYKEKNQHLTSILYNTDKMHDGAEKNPENYYYLYEYLENQLEVLGKLIKIQETQLENMERSFHDAVMQSYNLAKEIYDHVNRVADDSSIQLESKNRKVKMIEILLKDLEPEEKGFETMRLYIRERADEVKEQLKSGKTRKDVKDMISKFMSSEELLNVISDLSDLRIKAYKVDINAQNSRAKDWEKVMKENSGGERFVSFFAVMVALMSYARNANRASEDYNKKNMDSKVLLMDNPFGPISSEHLLKPLFDIAKKYNTQLICLTDLKQNSIMNQFKVIFMMKIVPNIAGTMEYLKVEESTYNGEEDLTEENLEMLNYYQEVEQISMLDD